VRANLAASATTTVGIVNLAKHLRNE
jgi:hypothetical protein